MYLRERTFQVTLSSNSSKNSLAEHLSSKTSLSFRYEKTCSINTSGGILKRTGSTRLAEFIFFMSKYRFANFFFMGNLGSSEYVNIILGLMLVILAMAITQSVTIIFIIHMCCTWPIARLKDNRPRACWCDFSYTVLKCFPRWCFKRMSLEGLNTWIELQRVWYENDLAYRKLRIKKIRDSTNEINGGGGGGLPTQILQEYNRLEGNRPAVAAVGGDIELVGLE
jgi:hypothetical protein